MKTPNLDYEIERLSLLERTNDLSEYGKELIAEYKAIKQALSLHNVVGSYDHCNIVDVVTNKTIFTAPANRFEVNFMDADKEVGKIQI